MPKPRYRPSRLSGPTVSCMAYVLRSSTRSLTVSPMLLLFPLCARLGFGSAAATCPPRGATSYHHPRRNDRAPPARTARYPGGGLAPPASRPREAPADQPDQGARPRPLVPREHGISRELDRRGHRHLPQLRLHREHATEHRHVVAMHRVEVGRRRRLGPLLDLGSGIRVIVQPLHDADARDADGAEREATVGQLGRLDDLRDGAHAEAHVATPDLAARAR